MCTYTYDNYYCYYIYYDNNNNYYYCDLVSRGRGAAPPASCTEYALKPEHSQTVSLKSLRA